MIDKESAMSGENVINATTPSVAVDPAGNAVAVWDQDGEQGTNGIRTAHYE